MKEKDHQLLLETVYLVNLTAASLKPLSRIEYPISDQMEHYIRKQGLFVEKITQSVANGGEVHIIVLSKDRERIDEAKAIFDGRPMSLNAETIRTWGRLLGFPSCCVEFFANEETRHSPNNISPEDQSILFHWACPDCSVTRELIPAYRRIWEETQQQ